MVLPPFGTDGSQRCEIHTGSDPRDFAPSGATGPCGSTRTVSPRDAKTVSFLTDGGRHMGCHRRTMAMIKSEAEPTRPADSGDLLLGPGVEFDGKLTFKGTVRIDAVFKGSIATTDVLIVGERARIDAEITCGTVIVHGVVNGNVRATSGVELRRTARVRGNVEAPSLAVEKGAVLHGDVRMAGNGAAAAGKPIAPASAA
jgi:cytoskeletal protein CcmA (bactofilin family)